MTNPSVIAIDGPAASGKTTLGQDLANALGYLYFDTGLMYRAVTFATLQHGIDIRDEATVTRLAEQIEIDLRKNADSRIRLYLDGSDVTAKLHTAHVDSNVSMVSTYPGVRTAMTAQQRRIGGRGQVVVVGRDIGTVVFPDADLKIYLEASVEERARRRFEERQSSSGHETYESTLQAMRKRDEMDSQRPVAPMRPAEDAIRIDTTHRSMSTVLDQVMGLVRARSTESAAQEGADG